MKFINSAFILLTLFISCTTYNPVNTGKDPEFPLRTDKKEIHKIQNLLKEAAYKYLGKESISVRGRNFAIDCSGVVSALYYYAGIDLQKYYGEYTGSGTQRIYNMLSDRGLLDNTWMPETGDIIFWDNTYDKNGNGKKDDALTHIGMVVNIDKFGNIEYIHHNYRKGIVLEKMNIRYKNEHKRKIRGNVIIINSPMKKMEGSGRVKDKWLSGQLYSSFGRGYQVF